MKNKKWAEDVPDSQGLLEMEADMEQRRSEFADLEMKKEQAKADEALARLQRIKEEQARRRKQYEDEDNELLQKLESELESRRRTRASRQCARCQRPGACEQRSARQ